MRQSPSIPGAWVSEDDPRPYGVPSWTAVFDPGTDGLVTFVPPEAAFEAVHLLAIYAVGSAVRGSEMLRALRAAYPGHPLQVIGAAPDAVGFWQKMQTRGLVDGWTMEDVDSYFELDDQPVAEGVKPAATPPPPPGQVRLYRAETTNRRASPARPVPDWLAQNPEFQAACAAEGRWFSETLDEARYYQAHFGEGRPITFVDIPQARLEDFRASNQPAGDWSSGGRTGSLARREFFVPPEVAAARRELVPQPPLMEHPLKASNRRGLEDNVAALRRLGLAPDSKSSDVERAVACSAARVIGAPDPAGWLRFPSRWCD